MNNLSPNQEKWCKKLQNAVNKMDEIDNLPFEVIQINLFGSASRDNPDPHDMDLVLIIKDELTLYAEFFQEIYRLHMWNSDDQKKNVYDYVKKQLKEKLKEALKKNETLSSDENLEALTEVGMKICHQWYPKLTWYWFNSFYSKGGSFNNFDMVMNRLVFSKYGVRPHAIKKESEEKAFGIHDTAKQFEIWSPKKKDIRENYLKIISRSGLKEDIIEELNGFHNQIESVNKYMPKIAKTLGLKWRYIRTFAPEENDAIDDLKWKIAEARRGLKVALVLDHISDRLEKKENISEQEILDHWKNPWELCSSITSLSKGDAKVETKKACLQCFGFNPIMAGDGNSNALDVKTFFLLFYKREYDWEKDHINDI